MKIYIKIQSITNVLNSSRKFSVQQAAERLIEVFRGEENNKIHS